MKTSNCWIWVIFNHSILWRFDNHTHCIIFRSSLILSSQVTKTSQTIIKIVSVNDLDVAVLNLGVLKNVYVLQSMALVPRSMYGIRFMPEPLTFYRIIVSSVDNNYSVCFRYWIQYGFKDTAHRADKNRKTVSLNFRYFAAQLVFSEPSHIPELF